MFKTLSWGRGAAYMVASTLSMVSPPWMPLSAVEAFFSASRVSLLMFAVSMLDICPSRFMICDEVCSSVFSNCFFFRSAARAAVVHHRQRRRSPFFS